MVRFPLSRESELASRKSLPREYRRDPKPSKLTARQTEALELVRRAEVKAVCIQYVWHFHAGSRNVSREVRALINKGLVDFMAFSGGRGAVNVK